MYATKCYHEQTAERSGGTILAHMHVEKVSSPAHFNQNRQKSKIEIDKIGSSHVIISQTVTDRANIIIANP